MQKPAFSAGFCYPSLPIAFLYRYDIIRVRKALKQLNKTRGGVMFVGLFLLYLLVFSAVMAALIYGLGLYIKKLANRPVKKFFTTVPSPAMFVFQMLEGKPIKIIENVTSWGLDHKGRFVPDNKKKKYGNWIQEILAEKLGVVWIGIYPTIKIFKDWEWPEFRQTKKKEGDGEVVKYQITARKKDVSEFKFQFSYSVEIEDVELEGNIRADIKTIFTFFNLDPIRAFFLNKDPVDLFIGMTRSMVRSWMSDRDFNTIKNISVSSDKSVDQIPEFWEAIEKFNGISFDKDGKPDYENASNRGLYGKMGIAIVRVEIEQINATGAAAKAIEAERIAQLNAKAKIAEADGDAQANVRKAEGDRDAMRARLEARKEWVEETIVRPTGFPGPHVADVLKAELVAGNGSKIQTWVEGDSSDKKHPRAIVTVSS